jgi:hypothetical protein
MRKKNLIIRAHSVSASIKRQFYFFINFLYSLSSKLVIATHRARLPNNLKKENEHTHNKWMNLPLWLRNEAASGEKGLSLSEGLGKEYMTWRETSVGKTGTQAEGRHVVIRASQG